jgi:excisionase family DNA binding protein
MSQNLRGVPEVAQILGVSVFTVRRLIDAGHIRAVNVASRRMVPSSEVDRILLQGVGKPRNRKLTGGTQPDSSQRFTTAEPR